MNARAGNVLLILFQFIFLFDLLARARRRTCADSVLAMRQHCLSVYRFHDGFADVLVAVELVARQLLLKETATRFITLV